MEAAAVSQILLLLPLATAGIIACFLRKLHRVASLLSVISGAVFSILGLFLIYGGARFSWTHTWFSLGEGFSFKVGANFDDLAALMLLVLIVVGFLVQVFSLGYMKGDPGKARFFAGLSFFMFSMSGIIMADNLALLFIFWELVGFSSYMLINHYYDRPSAVSASKKAFVVNRVGDFGLLLGILYIYGQFGTFDLVELEAKAGARPGMLSTTLGLLLFCGVLGKSAQMPLHVWLPDAMEGPTPISALIHAATMVAAGIYLTARVHFLMTPGALEVILWIGTITAVFAALVAFGQKDIKRILAFSTLSQLGYMVAALGLGGQDGSRGEGGQVVVTAGVAAAMFHLTTHGFGKALLFLNAGAILHACGHEHNIFRLGGLSGRMKLTFATFTLGLLAMGGFPFLSGFFSKDTILHLAQEENFSVYIILLGTAALTGLYLGRLYVVTFFGRPRSHQAERAEETGLSMTIPLLVLGVLSAIGGYGWFFGDSFEAVIPGLPSGGSSFGTNMIVAGSLFSLGGILIAWAVWNPKRRRDALEAKLPGLFRALAARLYIDDAYDWYVKKVQDPFSQGLSFFLDRLLVHGLMVRGVAGMVGLLGIFGRSLHLGSIHAYVYWFAAGVLLLGAIAFGIL